MHGIEEGMLVDDGVVVRSGVDLVKMGGELSCVADNKAVGACGL